MSDAMYVDQAAVWSKSLIAREARGPGDLDPASRTYTPVVGDLGDDPTVTVTASNGAGSGNATSAETAAVIAA